MNYKKESGFSLVELSVSLVIAGLAIAAITSGSHLIQAARLDKIVSEISGYVTAVNNFKDKYKAYPGDMPNATSFWAATSNGGGNEHIDEAYTAWQQLALAGIIAGTYTGVDAGTPDAVAGLNVPGSAAQKGAYYSFVYVVGANAHFGGQGTFMQLGATDNVLGPGSPFGSALISADAKLIDDKIDDGVAASGTIYTIRGNEYYNTAGKCVSNKYDDPTGTYVLTDSVISCRMVIWINKF